ncbi:hypothetical protein [Thalassotalea sp. SU-HH00458]|uniref:hypothetical protein n=1 Tax=Thalassotalea sp. SU-HH00458 TaxID=3127657 RepID=UPI003108B822
MSKSTQGLFFVLIFLLMGCFPKKQSVNYIAPQCLSSQSQCHVYIEQTRFDVLFNVARVTPEQTFNIIVKAKLLEDKFLVNGFLEGKEMYMGKIPLFFEKDGQGNFVASTMLGSCAEKEMIWRMWLTISEQDNPDKAQQVFIDFTSYRA